MSTAQVTEAHKALTESVCELLDSEEMIGPSPVERAAQLIADSEALAVTEIAMVAAASADRNVSLRLERDQLRAVFPKILEALGNGACCTPDVSVEFIKAIPNEVAEVVAELRAEVDAQCLLNGKGSEREAVLRGRIDRMTKECLNLRADLDAIKAIRDEEKARAESAEREVERLREWQAGVIANEREHHAERKDAIARAESAEAELADIRALANRRNKRDHSQDTTHQLVAALDQALDIAQAELATERARVDQLILTHPLYDSRDQLDAAMKEGA